MIFLTSREKERKKERKGRKKPHNNNNNIKPHARFNFATNGKRTSEKSGDGDDHEQSTASAKRRVFAGERLLDFVRVYHIVSILFYSFVSFRFSEEKRVAPSLLFSSLFLSHNMYVCARVYIHRITNMSRIVEPKTTERLF